MYITETSTQPVNHAVPKIKNDSTLGVLTMGYPYFLNLFRQHDTDLLEIRLLLQKMVCMKGKDAASVFYDRKKFHRKGAAPDRLNKTLFGQGGVQGLDGAEHLRRKELFMQCMDAGSISVLREHFVQEWKKALPRWKKAREVVLFYEAEKILCQTVCKWMQVPLTDQDAGWITREVSSMIEGSGAVGWRHFRGRIGRARTELWLEDLVEQVRDHRLQIPGDAIFSQFCWYHDHQGDLLTKEVVAVELLNLIRPTVAVARYIVFTALALHDYPEYRKKLMKRSEGLDKLFVQEVRRYYPFFPFLIARVSESFDWNGYHFPKGRRTLLDLYATNHDPELWPNPDDFHPERFAYWDKSPFNFIPQGGGEHYENHRCPGEWITIELTKAALNLLVSDMEYEVPPQNLHINLARIPAIPKSRFRLIVK